MLDCTTAVPELGAVVSNAVLAISAVDSDTMLQRTMPVSDKNGSSVRKNNRLSGSGGLSKTAVSSQKKLVCCSTAADT